MVDLLEGFEVDEIARFAAGLPGPHAWAWGTADIFYCQACYIAFELGAEPVPEGPCQPVYDPGPT